MYIFELRLSENCFELRGGQLGAPLIFRHRDSRTAGHLISFLSQKEDSVLRIRNATGKVVHACRFEPAIPPRGSVGGLHAPRMIA